MKIEVYSPTIRRKEMDAVLTAMVEDKIGPGEQARFLIQTAREKIKFDYCLALRSPAIALHLALQSLGLERGQAVLVSALSPLYYQRVIADLGLVPLYCDVASFSACLSRETVEKALASKSEGLDVRCIVLHHNLGYLGDAAAIAELGIPVIEDCSQSYGTYLQEEGVSAASPLAPPAVANAESSTEVSASAATGNVGVFTILGLEERDMLTCGGGALLYACNRRDSAVLRNLEQLPAEYGLPDMNAALAVVQFREAAKNLVKRREIANLYTQSALRTRHKRFVHSGFEYNNYAFPLILETGVKDVKAYARKKDTAVESAFGNTLAGSGGVLPEQCPEAYSLSLRTVLFPLYPRLKMSDAERIAKIIQTLP
jgi:dTDP-4-amino-4,6-dideoxygalactose transaminase